MAGERIGLVTVTYHSADVISGLLASIDSASVEPVVAVVVDNSPEDDGLAEIVAGHAGATLLESRDNPGYGGAMNRGVRQLPDTVEWIVLSNPDLVMSAHAIDEIISVAERIPDGGSFGPLIRNEDGSIYPSARKLPSLRTGVGHAVFVRIWPGNPWTASYRNEQLAVSERAVGWLSGSFLVVRRAAFEQVNGFDERYFMYFEDVDLGRNLGLAGWLNYYIPSAEVIHFGGRSTSRVAHTMIRRHHESAYKYLAKRYKAWYLWPVRVVLKVALFARGRFAKG